MGMAAGAFAAAATTPLDVIKTHMMCTAASHPSMRRSSAAILAQGGVQPFFRYEHVAVVNDSCQAVSLQSCMSCCCSWSIG